MKYAYNNPVMVDVTKPPYNCDNTGLEDCTEKLCRALNEILSPNIQGIQKALEKLDESDDPNYRISFEICKHNGIPNVIFPEELSPARILYFPKGTYLVSDTISHKLENLKNILQGVPTMEINRQIYIKGEDKDTTVIKLKDNCPGFGFGDQKPVISYIMTEKSNIAMTNSIADITIDCGSGNPGAIGVRYYSNNSGEIRNVAVKSSDKKGYCGISFGRNECYVKNLSVEGFDYGVRVLGSNTPIAMENITLKSQKVSGLYMLDSNVSVRNFASDNRITAFRCEGSRSLATIIDGRCMGGDGVSSGVVIAGGEAYIRNVRTEKYRWPLIIGGSCYHFDPYLEEINTAGISEEFFGKGALSLNLPIEDAPGEYAPTSIEDIAFVGHYGALGNGVTDDTDAIQRALNSGKPCICFGEGHYLVSGTVDIPPSVKTVDFMYCDFYSTKALTELKGGSLFRITGDADHPLTLKNVFTWEKFYGYFRFINHACARTLVLKNLHTQCAGMYFNSVPGGRVFVENCACTMGGEDYCTVSPFEFKGQRVWCRNINPERGDVQILNDNSDLWILGMKTETHVGRFASTAVKNINGGRVEGFGLYSGIGGKEAPLYINDNSHMSVYMLTACVTDKTSWDVLIREKSSLDVKDFTKDDAQKIDRFSHRVPGYVR